MKTNNDNESTRVLSMDEATQLINPGAPVSAEAMKKSPWAARLGFGIGGAAVGFAAGFASSATAGTHDTKVSGLAPAATPEDEMTPEQQADSTVHAREATTIDDPYDLPNSLQVEVEEQPATEATDDEIEVTAVLSADADNEQQAAVIASVEVETEPVAPVTDVEPLTPIDEIETVEIGTIPEADDVILENENGIRYGQVDDDMSFSEAFATARAQVGAPGVFVWHGNTYGTYYAEEWNAMSADERGQFLADVNVSDEYNHPVPVEPEIKVYDITYTLNAEGNLSGVANISIDDTSVTLLDVNGDQIMDLAVIHGEDEIPVALDDQNITLDDIVGQMDLNQDLADADMTM